MGFDGFPVAALDFYDDLEVDNTRSFWEAHKHVYTESVLTPMKALTAALEEEFGPAKIFRPYREAQFSANTPSAPRTSRDTVATWSMSDLRST